MTAPTYVPHALGPDRHGRRIPPWCLFVILALAACQAPDSKIMVGLPDAVITSGCAVYGVIMCDDQDPCTDDVCDLVTGECSHPILADCCRTDEECDDGDDCTDDACNRNTGDCQRTTAAACLPDGSDGSAPDASDGGLDVDVGPVPDGGTAPPGDWCRLDRPDRIEVDSNAAQTQILFYGRLRVTGITDQSLGVDTDAILLVQAGYGEASSDPSLGAGSWTWRDAAPNPVWEAEGGDEGAAGIDEYQTELVPHATDTFDVAYRYTLDREREAEDRTWVYCDRDVGFGSNGSEDGYQTAAAATLVYNVETVTTCRIREEEVHALTGDEVVTKGWLTHPPVTRASIRVDESPEIRAEGGYGPELSDPTAADSVWHWVTAEPNFIWRDDSADVNDVPGVLNSDEYWATFTAPDVLGTHDLAFRFSINSGASWIYCDRYIDAESDGGADGYQPENAAKLEVHANDCGPEGCNSPPNDLCDEDGGAHVYHPGICRIRSNDLPACDYSPLTISCSGGAAGSCDQGQCVGGTAQPMEPGDLLLTEVMFHVASPLEDNNAEWFEIHNPTQRPLYVGECQVHDDEGRRAGLPLIVMNPGDYIVLARSLDRALNGDLTPAAQHDVPLDHDRDQLRLTCHRPNLEIDTITYDALARGHPRGYALSLDPSAFDADANDDRDRWCTALETDTYGEADDGMGGAVWQHGTPGAPNSECPDSSGP